MTSAAYVRKASGVVRNVSGLDAFVFNTMFINIGVGTILMFTWIPYVFPGADMLLAILLSIVEVVIMGVVYAMLAAAMPRTGGEYVFDSRILAPVIGFLVGWTWLWADGLWIGLNSQYVFSIAGSVSFGAMGQMTGNAALTEIGNVMTQGLPSVVLTILLIVLCGLLMFFGTKAVFRAQTIFFIGGMAGTLITVALLAASSPSDFAAAFNSIAGTGAYQKVIESARGFGWQPSQFNLHDTIGASSIPAGISLFLYGSSFFSGEMKGADKLKTQILSICGAAVFAGAFFLLLALLLLRVVGSDFISAVGYVYFNHPEAYPLAYPPYYNLFAAILTHNPVLLAIMGLSFPFWTVMWPIGVFLTFTRLVFAMSFDRTMPAGLSNIHPRFRSPHNAILLASIVGIFFTLLIWWAGGQIVEWGWISTLCIMFAIVCTLTAAIVFPRRRSDIYQRSILANYRVGSFPLLTVCGVIGLIGPLTWIYFYLARVELGAFSPSRFAVWVGIWIAGALFYYSYKSYQARKGIDTAQAFKEIPVE